MNTKVVFKFSVMVIATVALFVVSRVATHHPLHSYLAPDFALQDMNGDNVRLSDFRGKAIVLNFWATWCPPCRREIPWFIALQKQYGPQGLQVIGVSMDATGTAAVEGFVKRTHMNYPVLKGDDHVASLYGGAEMLPTTYYIARDGRVVSSVTGLISESEVEKNIREALRQSAPRPNNQIATSSRPGPR